MAETVVMALGGNAILQPGQRGSLEEQVANVRAACRPLARVAARGHRLVLGHGNGHTGRRRRLRPGLPRSHQARGALLRRARGAWPGPPRHVRARGRRARLAPRRARPLTRLTARELEDLLAAGEFPPGSMGSKVEGAIGFPGAGGRRAVIARLEEALAAVGGTAGTQIVAGPGQPLPPTGTAGAAGAGHP